jgi:hypothetical protein
VGSRGVIVRRAERITRMMKMWMDGWMFEKRVRSWDGNGTIDRIQ